MAGSRQSHLRRDPFQRPTLTPGPLGHNDPASPNGSKGLVGDTPGPLGRNDGGDPALTTALNRNSGNTGHNREGKRGTLSPDVMVTSARGVKFIWNEEYVAGISERLHWPRGASGVTLGAGYDMKTRTKQQVYKDLLNSGLGQADCEIASEGAGLKGDAADSFVYNNRGKFHLTEEQALRLLRMILPSYEITVKKLVQVRLVQHEFDSLVSFAYNPGGRLRSAITFINNGNIEAAMACMSGANTSGGKVVKGLTARRRREVDLFRYGRYEL